jgi:threonine aldolase
MYDAMMNAPVGDDVFGEDPSINLLQERAAEFFGKEAALYCPSGTMTNQIAIQVHTRPGDEVICSSLAHIYLYEGGGIGKNAGCSVRLISGDKGRFTASQAVREINPPDDHYPRTSLVAIEDTCNKGGGSCYEFSEIAKLSEFCKEKGQAFHLDGARVFNALVAKGHDPVTYGKQFDSISICMSKGLGAPVGSLLLGDESFIKEAHRIRKNMGGGMRQA